MDWYGGGGGGQEVGGVANDGSGMWETHLQTKWLYQRDYHSNNWTF